jgi:hypothetical protein
MARTRRTACKSTGHLPVGQLAPRNVPPPQESQPDAPQDASLEEEPFETEEQQHPKDQDIEDGANEEYPPPSNTEDEKMYQDADEVESFEAEALVLADRL